MWRRLTEEEKKTLLANYKAGAYVVRILMGLWLVFVSFVYLEGIKTSVQKIMDQNYVSGYGTILAGVIVGVFLFGVPIYFMKTTGTEEIRALNNDTVFLGTAIYQSGGQSYRGRKMGRLNRHYAVVKLIDEWGVAGRQVQCRAIGSLKTSCDEGDRITVLKVVNAAGEEELICMKKKLL